MSRCTHRIRIKTVAEYMVGAPPQAAIMVPPGMSLKAVMGQSCMEACHVPISLASKARKCVEHDRKCDAAAGKRHRTAAIG